MDFFNTVIRNKEVLGGGNNISKNKYSSDVFTLYTVHFVHFKCTEMFEEI